MMAKITVYKGRPFLTLFSWLGTACFFCAISMLLSKAFLSAFWAAVGGIAILNFCNSRAAGRKARYTAGFAAVLILIYQALSLLESALLGMLSTRLRMEDFLLSVILAVVLFLPAVKNKPLAAAIGCFVSQALQLTSAMDVVSAAVKEPSELTVSLAAMMFLPALGGLILLLRSRKMSAPERQRYVF